MRLLYVNTWYNREMASLEDLLNTYSTMVGWAEAIHAAGIDVSVVQRFHRDNECLHNGIRFILVTDQHPPHIRQWQIPRLLIRAIQKACSETRSAPEPIVVHFNGLHFPLHLRAIRAALPPQSPVVVQHHAEKPWQGWRGLLQAWGLKAASGFFFAASELAATWVEQGMILSHQPVYQVMEGSTHFRRQDREAARARTGLTGDPVVLWVGRLTVNKDPLTVLRGFELIVQQIPTARLHMIYGTSDLLPSVRALIEGSNLLARSVTLGGSVSHPALESLYNSADYFVLGSHYEGSGYSLAEALACGVVPVVTDIPTFRAMTDGGRIGACWRPGDSAAFAGAFLRILRQPIQVLSDEAARYFENHLSYPAIARKAVDAYSDLSLKRSKQTL